MRSDIYWFAEICNSQCFSHFAASFIASRAEVSIVKGILKTSHREVWNLNSNDSTITSADRGTRVESLAARMRQMVFHMTGLEPFLNDPSAGSPTETLLRLILPLSDKVYETSRARNISVRTQSESFTGSLNR